MTPSPENTLEVRGENIGRECIGIVKLAPPEIIPPKTPGLDRFRSKIVIPHVIPQLGFYFPQSQDKRGEFISHVDYIEELVHEANHGNDKAIRQLHDSYKTTLVFNELITPEKEYITGNALEGCLCQIDKDSVFLDLSHLEEHVGHDIRLRPLYAFLALGEKDQRLILNVTREDKSCQFTYSHFTYIPDLRVGTNIYYRPIKIKPTDRNDFRVDLMKFDEQVKEDKPYFLAISGPEPTFAEYIK
ncbi:MAG: hypothetical protein V1858_04640 [Candidatus Gottesmanbacteria bacterium]